MTAPEIGVLLPIRIETRLREGDLWLRVIPDEPWFVRDDELISGGELAALARYVEAVGPAALGGTPPQAWRDLASQVGAPRAASLVRRFVTVGPGGTLSLRQPLPGEMRLQPSLPRIVGFPPELVFWIVSGGGSPLKVLTLTVRRDRLLADFADPDVPGDRRWWQDWDEAVAIGMAGIVKAADLPASIDLLLVTGIGDDDPAELFGALVGEGRIGLLTPGTPTNSVDGAPAAPLAGDADTWWGLLSSAAGDADRDVSSALTGNAATLGNLPGGEKPQRAPASAMVTALWPALWGFAASQVWDVARGRTPALWAGRSLFPEGAYPSLRIGPQPYGLLPTTAWSSWQVADGDPSLEAGLIKAMLPLRARHASRTEARGTAQDQTTEGLLDILSDTPTSQHFRFRPAWPLELWWLGAVSSDLPTAWRELSRAWEVRYPLADELQLAPLRRYGARGAPRLVRLPLVVPAGRAPDELSGLLADLAALATSQPSTFADTVKLETDALKWQGDSLLLRLAIRSLQLAIGDLGRVRDTFSLRDLEPFSRNRTQRGRLEQLIATVGPVDTTSTADSVLHLLDITKALTALGTVPVPDLERMLRAAVDCSSHRIDPWFLAPVQRRLDDLTGQGASRRLGAYGWVENLSPGAPGPTEAGLLHAPSQSQALTAAVLRDRAISDDQGRWDLNITSRRARIADRLAEQVRVGSHLGEALGREIERVVGDGVDIEALRTRFPLRSEHAGRRVCDGLAVLAADPFPLSLDADQQAQVVLLREAMDTYGDLLVAEAVHHLVEGRSDVAGAVMDAAAGLARPPDFALLHTQRDGRAVSTSALAVLPSAPDPALPPTQEAKALDPPVTRLDPSVAAFLVSSIGPASAWDFIVSTQDSDASGRPASATSATGTSTTATSTTVAPTTVAPTTVTLADLGLAPADALSLSRTDLERLASELVVERLDLDPGQAPALVVGGSAASRYEGAAGLVGLLGRNPAGTNAFSEASTSADEDRLDDLASRLLGVRGAGQALSEELQQQVDLFADTGIGTADPDRLALLVRACTAWGIAPDPPLRTPDPGSTSAAARLLRLVDVAIRALPQLNDRLAAGPQDAMAIGALGRTDLLAAASALVAPTGQVAITGTVAAQALPALARSADLDAQWLTVAAAVRPALARLEVHQLRAEEPLAGWTNRPDDPWQTSPTDGRRLLAVYASGQLELGAPATGTMLAGVLLDRFSEVVPAQEQRTGAAFGFDAPASRAPQAILLAVPPQIDVPLDQEMLVRILVETRDLAHARMARPIDLDDEFLGLAPTGLLPATGNVATPLEVRG